MLWKHKLASTKDKGKIDLMIKIAIPSGESFLNIKRT